MVGLAVIGLAGCDDEEDGDDRAGGGVGSALAVVGVMERRVSVEDGGVGGFCMGWRGVVTVAAVNVGGCIDCCCSTG